MRSAEASRSLAGWWADLLGATRVDDDRGYSWLQDIPGAPFFSLEVVPVPEAKTAKNRVHLDLYVDRVEDLVAAGAQVLTRPTEDVDLTVMADPDGNEFCAVLRG